MTPLGFDLKVTCHAHFIRLTTRALRAFSNQLEDVNTKRPPTGGFSICELTVSQVEPLFDSVIRTYYKLDELGIKEVDGQIIFIDNMEVSHE